jgi:hypothetical protein
MAKYGEKDDTKCPECGLVYETRCRCFRADSQCKLGHTWHICTVHKVVVKHIAGHFVPINKCTCVPN